MARREYAWDGQGQAYVLTDERRWLWQGQLRIVAELDGDGELVKRFVYGTKVNVPEYMVTYDPVSHLETGTYRILTDQLGSLRLVVDVSDGTVVQRMRHDEWGNVLEDTTPGLVPFGFAGGLYDPATGLVRFGARDYDPETGRWTGKDPILFKSNEANVYLYIGCEPVNLIDPSGLLTIRCKMDCYCFAAFCMCIAVEEDMDALGFQETRFDPYPCIWPHGEVIPRNPSCSEFGEYKKRLYKPEPQDPAIEKISQNGAVKTM